MQSVSSDNCVHRYNVYYPKLQLINTKPMIKEKSQELLSELKKFETQAILGLVYKKRHDRKIFHSRAKLNASDSDINEAFKSMHQSIMTKIKKLC